MPVSSETPLHLLPVLLATVGALTAYPSVAAAQETPEAVAAAVLRADSIHDWRLLLALTHPDALREFRHNQLQIFKTEDLPGYPGLDA